MNAIQKISNKKAYGYNVPNVGKSFGKLKKELIFMDANLNY